MVAVRFSGRSVPCPDFAMTRAARAPVAFPGSQFSEQGSLAAIAGETSGHLKPFRWWGMWSSYCIYRRTRKVTCCFKRFIWVWAMMWTPFYAHSASSSKNPPTKNKCLRSRAAYHTFAWLADHFPFTCKTTSGLMIDCTCCITS